MDGIGRYLRKHKNLTPPNVSAKKIFVSFINNEYGISLNETEVKVKGGGVYLSCHPTVRSEIVLNTTGLLEELSEKYNIRFSFIR